MILKLGTCPRCIRLSLLATLAAWTLAATALFVPIEHAAFALACVAAALTGLWAAHLLAAASRIARAQAANGAPDIRRRAVSFFLPSLAAVAFFSIAPASAQTDCDRCSRFKGKNKCWECCRCQNTNCISGCRGSSNYNKCVDGCSTGLGNCNRGCS